MNETNTQHLDKNCVLVSSNWFTMYQAFPQFSSDCSFGGLLQFFVLEIN